MPFGDFMTDKGTKRLGYKLGLHSRYYPGEWSSAYCREFLKSAESAEDKTAAYDIVCDHHSASFRYFFLEQFGHSPARWHCAKMRYTRSVAINSMVGHILGIGDRHCSNILVHRETGEVVHIDFGIVFEQGKTLKVPEIVPFRLTRNIVDGFGPLGTEGTFTKTAEQTLDILKENSDALLTILSALVADPLYRWTISRVQALKFQREMNEEDLDQIGKLLEDRADSDENEAAAHAIARVHEKLQGYEDGTAGEQQTTESQVQLLIEAARSQDNLSQMFPGWAPWI